MEAVEVDDAVQVEQDVLDDDEEQGFDAPKRVGRKRK